LGINQLTGGGHVKENGTTHNGDAATNEIKPKTMTTTTTLREKLPFLLLQVSVFQTLAGPIGFSALRHISYPTMVLGKVSFSHLLSLPVSFHSSQELALSHLGSRSGQRRGSWKSDEGNKGKRPE
jgi:hypothetical protein